MADCKHLRYWFYHKHPDVVVCQECKAISSCQKLADQAEAGGYEIIMIPSKDAEIKRFGFTLRKKIPRVVEEIVDN